MNCELCSTDGQDDETRCQKCGFDTSLPASVKSFLISLTGFRPGDLLEGRYRIERILGFGGMSVVYKAHDDMLGEDVAIKVINRGQAGDDAKFFTDIRRDIVTTRKLAHPDIIKVHDLHKAATIGFLTMEYVQGKDLASLIAERGKLEEGEVCRVAAQVAEALNYAHANGVVHCDIKPGNILLTETGRVKIADFGISRVMQEENTGLTGLVVGTPAYMSPEQIKGERPTPLTDMYALGIVMWHCLMGAPPYTRGDIAYQHVHVPLPPLEGVDPQLERIVRKAASKNMADRYPSLDIMAQELHRFLRRRSDATIMQTPPPREAATIMQTPPPRPAIPIMRTPPLQQAATIAQTPPPQPAATVMQSPPARPAGSVMQTPPPRPVVAPSETTGREARADDSPPGGESGGGGPPATGPAGGTTQPSPASSPLSMSTKVAMAALAVLFAGAVLWGLIPSPQPTAPAGSQGTPVGKALSPSDGTATIVGSTAESGATRRTSSRRIPYPGKTTRSTVGGTSAPQTALETQPGSGPGSGPAADKNPLPVKCIKPACFEIFDARITPAEAQPGQTVNCTARYTFRHNEGGAAFLEVEESVTPGIRFNRGASRRVKAGPGENLFEVSFKISGRVSAGTYPVTLSVRRRSITESVKLQLVVTK